MKKKEREKKTINIIAFGRNGSGNSGMVVTTTHKNQFVINYCSVIENDTRNALIARRISTRVYKVHMLFLALSVFAGQMTKNLVC